MLQIVNLIFIQLTGNPIHGDNELVFVVGTDVVVMNVCRQNLLDS